MRGRRTFSRLRGRLLTGPLAFFVSFLIDLAAYWLGKHTRRRPSSGP